MRKGVLDTESEKSKLDFYKILKELKPGEYIYEIKKLRAIRSIKQNSFYWAVIQLYAIHTGHTAKEIEFMFKMARWHEEVEYPSGKRVTIPKDTHDLDTAEFSVVVNNLLQWGSEEFPAVIVPRREDLTYAQWMEIGNQYERTFSGY